MLRLAHNTHVVGAIAIIVFCHTGCLTRREVECRPERQPPAWNPGPIPYKLCDLGQVTAYFWAVVFLLVKQDAYLKGLLSGVHDSEVSEAVPGSW